MAEQAATPTIGGFTLTLDSVDRYATSAGLDTVAGSGELLTGGVSSVVIALDGRPPVVIKQALAQLAVEARWDATPERATTEVSALRLTHALTPDNVPEVLLADSLNHVLAIERAPSDWQNWREMLLERPVATDIERARELGRVLGRWHAATWHDETVQRQFCDDTAFEQLRVDPFYREVRRRHPALSTAIDPLIEQVTQQRQCLVHGDYSPKNVLVGEHGIWVLDHEVARFGASVFDLAFMAGHLLLKATHRPDSAGIYLSACTGFLEGYATENARPDALDGLGAHVAVLLLARVDGKSPAGYLTAAERARIRGLAIGALSSGAPSLDSLWHATTGGDAA